jgi:drug/metabolite transporter (DMT)-like permease
MIRRLGESPLLGLTLAALLWSGNFVVGRALRIAMAPLSINFWRWAIALGILLPLTLDALKRHRGTLARHWKLIALLGLTGIASFQTLVFVALSMTTAVKCLLLLSLAPLAIALASSAVFGERLSAAQLAGIALSFAGAVVLVAHGSVRALAALSFGAGDLWMLLAVALWTVYSLLLKRAPPELPQLTLLSASATAGVLFMLPFYLRQPPYERLPSMDWQAWSGLLYIGLIASVPPFLLWNRGVARIGPSRAGVFIYLMPLFGAVLSFVFLGEAPHGYELVGGISIFTGIAVMSLKPFRRPGISTGRASST